MLLLAFLTLVVVILISVVWRVWGVAQTGNDLHAAWVEFRWKELPASIIIAGLSCLFVGIAYEWVLRSANDKKLTAMLMDGVLLDKSVLLRLDGDHRQKALRAILEVAEGDELGGAIHDALMDGAFGGRHPRYDLRYTVELENLPENDPRHNRFLRAKVTQSVRGRIDDDEVLVHCARVSSSQFTSLYKQLADIPESVYRWLIKTDEVLALDESVFDIRSLKVGGIELKKRTLSLADDILTVTCQPRTTIDQLRLWRVTREGEVDMEIEVHTLLDRQRRELPVVVGYPYRGLDVNLYYTDANIKVIDIVDYVTTTGQLTEECLHAQHHAYIRTPDADTWVLPSGGISFIWKDV